MGANLIGYQTMMPVKLTKEEKKIFNNHLDELDTLLKGKDFIKKLAKEKTCDDPILKKLYEIAPLITSEMENLSFGSEDEEDQEELKDLIDSFIEYIPEARKFINASETNFGGEDTSYRTYTILGRNFYSVFAGEMSWGDEPDGEGYQLLKNLDRVGVLSLIEKLTIPSQSLSVQFIKE
jgi:hypothetical protein